jgi:hypothetical protein
LNTDNLSYVLETSSNLNDWDAAGENAETLSAVPTGDDITEEVRVRILPALEAGPIFVRLRVLIP